MVAFLVPIDVIEELNGDAGVLAFTAFALGLLLYLRREWEEGRKLTASPSGTPV